MDKDHYMTSTPMFQSTSKSKIFPMKGEEQILKFPFEDDKRPMAELICEAIKEVGVPRKGASYQAIVKYIQSKKNESAKLFVIKRALSKGIETGLIVRPSNSKGWMGIAGFYNLPKPVVKVDDALKAKKAKDAISKAKKAKDAISKPEKVKDATSKPKKNKVQKEQVSDSETVVKKPKRNDKLNLSDSVINDIKKTKPKSKLINAKTEKPLTKTAKSKTKLVKAKTVSPTVAVKNSEEKTKPGVKTKKLAVKKKVTEDKRKDVSDSEFVVKKPGRKSLKSYSSDTEADRVTKPNTATKLKQTAQNKETKAAKNKAGGEPPAKLKGKKLFKVEQNQSVKLGATAKVGKARTRNLTEVHSNM